MHKKNTLFFLLTEGIGLNKNWKGNYLKLSEKTNINYLISGIFPWTIVSNTLKSQKNKLKKKYEAVETDTDKNFYQMFYGTKDIKTYNDLLKEAIDNKTIHTLPIFSQLKQRAEKTGSNKVHLFSLLTKAKNQFDSNALYYIINILLSLNLKPVLHLIADGQYEKPFSFYSNLINFSKFLKRRNLTVATISGKDHVFIKHGKSHLANKHVFTYFETINGIVSTSFDQAIEYAAENLANKVSDSQIVPALNTNNLEANLEKDDSVLFLNNDPDAFSCLASMMKTEQKLNGIYLASLVPIYGTKLDAVFFENPINNYKEQLLTNVATHEANKVKNSALILSLNHKKGFIKKFFGENDNEHVKRKIIDIEPHFHTEKQYYSVAAKALFDKAIDATGEYDIVIVHCPTIAEAARKSDLKNLLYAIEQFDKNLGRLLNLTKSTGNIIAFTSAYGACEKMLDKKLNLVPYNKNSPVPFVFTNGDVGIKKIKSNFISVYASILTTLDVLDQSHPLYNYSLITSRFTKNKIQQLLNDAYTIWRDEIAAPLIKNFEEEHLNFYNEFSKDEEFLAKKRKYIVLKEILDVSEKVLLTPDARRKLSEVISKFIDYNKIDFFGFDINYKRVLEDLFQDEVKIQKLSKFSSKYLDRKIWITNFDKNDKWINEIKYELFDNFSRKLNLSIDKRKLEQFLYKKVIPFTYFENLKIAEMRILETNDAKAIAEFYEDIEEDVINIYEAYIGDNLVDETDEDGEYEKTEEEIRFENLIRDVSIYYDYLHNIFDLIKSEKGNLETYNKKCAQNYKEAKEHDILEKYEKLPINEKPDFLVNKLANKILKEKGFCEFHIRQSLANLLATKNKDILKYNNAFNLKISTAYDSIVYNDEFNENIDRKQQRTLWQRFLDQFGLYKEFDNQELVIKVEKTENDNEDIYDEEGNILDINKVNKNIKISKENDLTELWISRQKAIHNNLDGIKEDVTLDVFDELAKKAKYKEELRLVKEYKRISRDWLKQSQQQSKELNR